MAIVTNQVASEAPTMQQMRVLSRREIEGMISEGQHIIIVSQYVLKVDSWLSYHPGGDKTIMHMVGRDATNEVTVYVLLTLSIYSNLQINFTLACTVRTLLST